MGVLIIEDRFILKTKVFFNSQSLQYLKQIKGTRAFIVSDSIMETLGYLKEVIDYLAEAGIDATVFTGVRPDPDVSLIADGLKLYKDSDADVLIGIGGGSAIDTAKGILYFKRQLDNSKGIDRKKPLFIAIPSTSGTGSEVTDFSVVTAEGEKIVIIDEFIAPDIAILDSTCIKDVPNRVVVDTGIDVLVHAIEAYLSTKATDFTDALAEKSIKLIFENLENLYKNTNDQEARDRVLNASCLAGIAFTNAGLGINHSLAHALGGTFHLSHGRSNALLLNAVIEYNSDLSGSANGYAAQRYAKLAKVLELPARTRREGTVSLMLAINKLKKALGVEDRIRDLGVDQSDFKHALEKMAGAAIVDRCTPTNPRKPSTEEIKQIFQKCF
jgi:alcohol dehydrogenase class IV